ncbi:MAG: hypothetical protein GEU68_14145 [Actinobacteria bacterium]|nr:hypothetical protein [Actinomycetota bacterium]
MDVSRVHEQLVADYRAFIGFTEIHDRRLHVIPLYRMIAILRGAARAEQYPARSPPRTEPGRPNTELPGSQPACDTEGESSDAHISSRFGSVRRK